MNREQEKIDTPCFVINKEQLDYNIDSLRQSLKQYWPNHIIGYSFKTNALPWIVNYYREKGCLAEVVSESEYELALTQGYRKNQIIYNGPIKREESFLEAMQNGAIVNIDSKREIGWLKKLPKAREYTVGIRVNYDIESECPGESTCGIAGGRFGFNFENGALKEALEKINELGNVRVVGLHLHISSKTRSLKIYKSIANKACEIQEQFKLDLKYVDIGGGFFGGVVGKPSFNEYFSMVASILKKMFNPQEVTLIVEPGISIIGSPVDYICKVIDYKVTNLNEFVVTDGSRIHIDPLMHKSSYAYNIIQKEPHRICDNQVICGFTCMENDRLLTLYDSPKLKNGDTIIFHKVGAYTMCLSPLFIEYFPRVYVKEYETLQLVRKKWTVKEYIQGSKGAINENEYTDFE